MPRTVHLTSALAISVAPGAVAALLTVQSLAGMLQPVDVPAKYIGSIFLGEGFGARRISASLVVAAGLVLLAFAQK